jgi:hypothetical protein
MRTEESEGTDAALPHRPLVLSSGAATGTLRQVLDSVSYDEWSRLADPSGDPVIHSDNPMPPGPVALRPKATFQRPPDCLWALMGYKLDKTA